MSDKMKIPDPTCAPEASPETGKNSPKRPKVPTTVETGGPKGLEPTRYGDWEKKGRCIDF